MEPPGAITGEPLLYDPLFETPPDTVIRDTSGRGSLRFRKPGKMRRWVPATPDQAQEDGTVPAAET